ncbi:transcription factor IIIC subunit delta N-term-domain-containing protein [Pyronema omphalodes]|nr:transcription factor IIIC subunit delta N-term-domain-containing protein [Pyronema omphalodes]
MLKTVRLKLLPTVINCLSWSPEGALAIISGEDVVILYPKIPQAGQRVTKQNFHILRANMRQLIIDAMEEEIPPAPAPIYSIGEEQGPGYGRIIAWSPLGLSRYRKSLLAVVSTNYKIYIFEPVGRMSDDMRVVHDLTPMLADYDGLPEGDEKVMEKAWRKRLRARCMGMAWSQACVTEGNRWGESLVALANDYLEIVLFRVSYDKKEIVGHFVPFAEENVAKYLGERLTHVSNIKWSPWVHYEDKKYWAFLAYSWNGMIMVSTITMDMGDLNSPKIAVEGEPFGPIGKAISERHPVWSLAFVSEVIGDQIVLAYAVQTRSTIVTFGKDRQIKQTIDFKNDFLEPISGLAFAPSETPDTVILQTLTVKGRSQVITCTVSADIASSPISASTIQSPAQDAAGDVSMTEVPTDEELRIQASTWPSVLAEMKQDYMEEYDIPCASIRGYGLAVSPLGGITAVVASLHPKDSLEYITGNNEKTSILFGTTPGSSGSWSRLSFYPNGKMPNPTTIATESMIQEAQALGEVYSNRIFTVTSAGVTEEFNPDAIKYTEGEDVNEFLAKHVLLERTGNAHRYLSCLKLLEKRPLAIPENPYIIGASIITVLRAPRHLCKDDQSKRILYSMACVGIMGLYRIPGILELSKQAFKWLDEHTPEDIDFNPELNIIDIRTRKEEPSVADIGSSGFVSKFEKCRICAQGMIWRDLRIAECTNGHRFSRCAMTFLPITDPMATRECGVCCRMVLGSHQEGVTRTGLLKAVWASWEACLHCGGRFWAEDS